MGGVVGFGEVCGVQAGLLFFRGIIWWYILKQHGRGWRVGCWGSL